MSEYNELYQAVQPESPQVVPDEVRFVYIPKAQKGVAGLAWFNEEHFDVSGDSEVSLSATVLGNIDKKLDKVTESPTGHDRVYGIYGDGREDPQTMWDLDDTGVYSTYHIPSSDGRGYLKVKDPVDARNPVNKQFLDEKLKGKLDDLGKTSGVFPAAYVRQQGIVSGHDYGKSIEVHGTPDAYTIPVRDAYGALTSASPNSPNDVVTLEYAESHYLKTQPYTNGDGLHSLIFNEIYTNFAFSRDSNVFGENSMVGLWGVRYTAIDTTENSLTIGTISSSPFNVGERLNIVNDKKYDRSCTFVKYENGKVYVDKLPFSAIVEGDTGFDAYTISSEDNPILSGHYKDGASNIIDLGKYAFSVGDHNKALNYATFLGGVYNKAYGEYGTAFGRNNEVGYAGFATGRNNSVSGWYSAATGRNNSVSGLSSFAAGDTNLLSGVASIGLGYYNTLTKSRGYALGFYNVIKNPAGFAIGRDNTLEDANQDADGTVLAFGQKNVVKNSHTIAIGRNNYLVDYNSHAFGTGLNSTVANQTLLGLFNDTSSTAPFVFGYGTENARKNLATIESDGTLRLAGHELKLNTATASPSTLSAYGIDNLNEFLKYSSHDIAGWTYKRTFTSNHARVTNSLSVGGNLNVAGNFTVTGTTTVKDVKNLAVEDLTITLGKNLPGLGASLAGLVVPDYNGMQQPGGLVFDDTGTAYVGDVGRASDGTVSIGNAKPIAVRSTASEWSDNNIPRWNTAFEGFEPSGFTTDSFVQKNTETHGYYLYARMRGTEGVIAYSNTATANCIPYYNAGGVLRAGTAVGDNDAVNLKQLTDGWVKKHVQLASEYDLLYGQNKSGDIMFTVAHRPTSYAIPSYSDTKTLRTVTATADNDCVNLAQMKGYAVPIKTAAGTPDLYNVTGTPFVYGHINSAGTETETTIGLAYDDNSIAALIGSFKIPVMDQDGMLRSAGVVGTLPEAGGTVLPNCYDVNSIVSSAQEKLVLTYLKLPSNKTGTNGQILVASGYEDYYDNTTGETTQYSVLNWADPPKAVRHWVATLVKASDPDVNGGQIEFWSTGTPNSETNPTNFNDLFAKRVGKALVRGIDSSSNEYFVYMLGVGGLTGVRYYTAYPFTEMNTAGVTYDSVTLAEVT